VRARSALNKGGPGAGKSADKAVCAAVSQALSGAGNVVALPAAASLAGLSGGLQVAWRLLGSGQASTHTPLSKARPRLMRLRRLRAAVRRFSQALFLAVPR
jgi:hypothetical protein